VTTVALLLTHLSHVPILLFRHLRTPAIIRCTPSITSSLSFFPCMLFTFMFLGSRSMPFITDQL
jgi:hypothetical protein